MRKLITLLLAAFAVVSQAAPPIPIEPPSKPGEVWTKQQVEDARKAGNLFKPATELYRASEFQLDVFGAYAASDIESLGSGDYGAGIGFNYFFSRNIGVGLEARHTLETSDDFLNRVGLNLFVRFPIGRVAPYVIAGAGTRYQHHNVTWRASLGGGIQVQLSGNVGLFSDVRFIQKGVDKFADDGYVGRAGVRLSF
jgi:hypothetical protein